MTTNPVLTALPCIHCAEPVVPEWDEDGAYVPFATGDGRAMHLACAHAPGGFIVTSDHPSDSVRTFRYRSAAEAVAERLRQWNPGYTFTVAEGD